LGHTGLNFTSATSLFGGLTASKDVADVSSKDAAAEPANAAGSNSGFSRLTHAAEFYASQAATQAAGLFSYKTGDEKSQERNIPQKHVKLGEMKPSYIQRYQKTVFSRLMGMQFIVIKLFVAIYIII
jgi:hypothetical protein